MGQATRWEVLDASGEVRAVVRGGWLDALRVGMDLRADLGCGLYLLGWSLAASILTVVSL